MISRYESKENQPRVKVGLIAMKRSRAQLVSAAIVGFLVSSSGIAISSTAHASSYARSTSFAHATTNKAGGACKTEGAKTMIGTKNYICKNTSTTKVKKLVWTAAPTLGAPNGAAGGKNGGPDGFGPDGDNDHGANNPALQKAFAAFSACVVKNGGKAITPGVHPSETAAQKKAEAACASLRPKGPGDGHGRGEFEHQGGEDDDGPGMTGKAAPLVAPSKSPGA